MNLDRRLLKLLSTVRLPLWATVAFGLLGGLLTIVQAWYLATIINDVFLQGKALQDELSFLLIFTIVSIAQAAFRWLSHVAGHITAGKIKFRLRRQLVNKLDALGPLYARGERSGELSNTMMNGVEALEAYFSQYIPQLFFSSVIPLTVLFFVFPQDILSGVVMLVTAPIIPVFMILIGHLAQSLTQKQWKTLSRMSAYFLDVLQGLTTLKILGRSHDEEKKIARISDAFRRTTMNVLKVAFLSALVLEMAATISTAVIAVEIGLRLLYAKISFQPALFILILAPEFYQPIRQLGARFHAGMEGVSAAQRIFEILETPMEPPKVTVPSVTWDLRQSISFAAVSYTYPGAQQPVLQEISFRMPPQSITAVVGASGAGKTTLSQLLMRFLQPQSGTIFIGEHALTEIDLQEWRRQIAWVPQNPYIFNRTIRENLLIANPAASEEQITEAARLAHLHDFVTRLPQGYDTEIGEQGTRLSGGQAQRLALARAFLKDAPLLILDEPTANLDPQLEEQVQRSVNRLARQRTTLLIAHRLSTVEQAEQIIVLKKGRIAESGSRSDLIQKQGLFYRLLHSYGGTV